MDASRPRALVRAEFPLKVDWDDEQAFEHSRRLERPAGLETNAKSSDTGQQVGGRLAGAPTTGSVLQAHDSGHTLLAKGDLWAIE